MHPNVHCSVIYNSQDLEAVLVPISRGVDKKKKLCYICPVEYYFAIKKKEILTFATALMDLEIIMLSEVNQSERDKNHMISLMCRI